MINKARNWILLSIVCATGGYHGTTVGEVGADSALEKVSDVEESFVPVDGMGGKEIEPERQEEASKMERQRKAQKEMRRQARQMGREIEEAKRSDPGMLPPPDPGILPPIGTWPPKELKGL